MPALDLNLWKTFHHLLQLVISYCISDAVIFGCCLPFRLCKWIFFNCYFAAPLPTMGHSPWGQPRQADVNHCILAILTWSLPKALQGCGSLLNPAAEWLVGFEPGTFRFYSQCINPRGYSPRIISVDSGLLKANTPITLAKQLLVKACFLLWDPQNGTNYRCP